MAGNSRGSKKQSIVTPASVADPAIKPILTIRQRKLITELAKGTKQKDAARLAGYNSKYAEQVASTELKKLEESGTFAEIMTRLGITDESLVDDIQRLRKFSRSTIVRKLEGEEIVEVADGQVQLGAVKLAVQLKGHLVEKDPAPATIIINMMDYNAKKD